MAMPQAGEAGNGADKVQLDELMLAMDMVDTLRHQEDLVARELDHEVRDAELRTRPTEIYTSQGLDVSEPALDAGIRALREDRFVYRAPKPSLALRMAGLYVDRGKWAKRGVVVGVLGGGGWLAADGWQDMQAASAERKIETRRDAMADDLRTAEAALAEQGNRHQRAGRELAAIGSEVSAEVAAAHGALATRTRSALAQAGEVLSLARAAPAPTVSTEADLDAQEAQVRSFRQSRLELVQRADSLLDGVEADIELLGRLRGMAPRIAALRSIGAGFSGKVGARIAAAQGELAGALAAADAAAIERALVSGEALVDRLRQAYTLRVVQRDGVQSGVWRYKEGGGSARNYYIVVEAIDPNGQVLRMPIENEETGSTETVGLFAVRVPESVYEQVKQDKLDNGLIDDALFGEKRSGELDVQYRRPVAGGFITRW